MADQQDQAEPLDDDLDSVEAEVVRNDPDGERVEGAQERPEHLAEDPTTQPAEEAPAHIESQ